MFCFVFIYSDIVFSTAHKAKGLEFDTVRVTDDFLPGTDLGLSIRESTAFHFEISRNFHNIQRSEVPQETAVR